MNKPFLIPPAELEGIGFTADEFEAMAASGAFAGMPVELAGGELVKAGGSAGFTADEFAAMAGGGALQGMRVELVGGRLVRVSPSNTAHSRRVALVSGALYAHLGKEAPVLIDPMLLLADDRVLAPDIVLATDAALADGPLPVGQVLLAIEVSDTSIGRDLGWKARDYARAGIPHYWVVDIAGAVTHVFSAPGDTGFGARTVVRFTEPLSVPGHAAVLTLA